VLKVESGAVLKKNQTKSIFFTLFNKYPLIIGFLALIMIFYLMEPRFLSKRNIFNIILQVSILAPLAIGETLVILTRGIDISIGSILAISSAVCGGLLLSKYNILLCCFMAIAVGAGLGFCNGITISYLGIPPLIATLAMMSIARGLQFLYTLGATLYAFPKGFRYLGTAMWFGIPAPIYLTVVVFILFHLIMKYTIIGRSIYAIGGNPEAARISGISIRKVTLLVYTISGILCAVGGMILLMRMDAMQNTAGSGIELEAIAAVVIGGTSIAEGGAGSIYMTALGTIIYGVILNGLNIVGVNPFSQRAIIGTIILVVVAIDCVIRKKRFST